jgi:hypothetical protein
MVTFEAKDQTHSMYRIFLAFFALMCLAGCSEKRTPQGPDQGLVRYQIDYPPEIAKQAIVTLLPQEMDLFFKDQALKIKISGEYNVFALEFLSKAEGDSCFTLFKVFNKKMVYQLAENEKWFFFDRGTVPAVKVIRDSVRHIAGLECRLAELTYKEAPDTKIYAYYTNQLNINNKLLRSPLGNLDGIPLQFEVLYNGLKFRFTAQSFLPFPKDEYMDLPSDYDMTTRQEIRSLIDSVLN